MNRPRLFKKIFSWNFAAFLAVIVFLLNSFSIEWVDFSSKWNTTACAVKKHDYFPSRDCRHYYSLALFAAQSVDLSSNRWPFCVSAQSAQFKKASSDFEATLNSECAGAGGVFKPEGKKIPDLGWDAYAIWFGRASYFYLDSEHRKKNGECGSRFSCLFAGLKDLSWIKKFPNREHFHYPVLLPFFYALLMTLFGTLNPVILQVAQVLAFCAVGFLYWSARRRLSLAHVLCFALVPISGIFLFRLYAEIWMLLVMLLTLWFFDRKKYLVGSFVLALLPWIKAEGFFVALLFLVMSEGVEWSAKDFAKRYKILLKKSLFVIPSVGALLFCWNPNFYDSSFWVPLSARIAEPAKTLPIFLDVMRYFLDVLFRPGLWGVLSWVAIYFVISDLKQRRWLVPGFLLIFFVLTIVAAFIKFPFGHKEVVLTGSNRALWQLLPLLWIYLRAREENSFKKRLNR